MKYFSYLPQVTYNGKIVRNILARGKIRDMILNNSVAYYPYAIEDGDRPDILAHKYYGSSDHTWIILYANEIFDPFYDWPLEQEIFDKMITSKYDEIRINNTTKYHLPNINDVDGNDVNGSICTTQEFCQLAVGEYRNLAGLVLDKASYLALDANQRTILSIYELEDEKNEAKRNIKIIDKVYLTQIIRELKVLFQ